MESDEKKFNGSVTEKELAEAFVGPIQDEKESIVSSPEKKSHKAIIISAICVVAIVIGGLVFAIVGLNSNKGEPVVAVTDLTDEQREKLGIESEKEDDEDVSEIEDKNNYSDEYKEYQKLSDEEKAKLEVIPRKEKISDDELNNIKRKTDDDVINTLPDKFDLRDVIEIEVEDQGIYGLCWDYASSKAFETHLKLRGIEYDPSEYQVDFLTSNLMYGNRELHSGGTFQEYVDIASSIGIISEEMFSNLDISLKENYSGINKNYNYFRLTSNDDPLYITETVDFPSVYKTAGKVENKTDEELEEFRNLVKAHIMTNGALYAVMNVPDVANYYTMDSAHGQGRKSPHAMAIVGWDDNYSKDNFFGLGDNGEVKPVHDGAYLVLNSWGSIWRNGGYFWVSYDEYNIESQLSGVISTSLDDTVKISSIESQVVKDLIKEKLGFYIIERGGEEYISDYALNRVSYLDLSSRGLTNDDLDAIAEVFSNITSLTIADNNISDLSSLKKFKNLYGVYFSKNNVEDISVLCDMDVLNNFDFSYNQIRDVSCLSDKPGDYMYLDISGNVGITGYEKISNLTTLIANEIGLESLESLYNLKNLESLSVRDNNIKNLVGLNPDVEKMYNIDLSGNNELNDLTFEKPLYRLMIEDADLNDISILNNIKVESVYASGNHFGDLSNFNNDEIFYLDLSDNGALSNLSSLKNLKSLNLSNCNITSLDDFSAFDNIESLNLSRNNIDSLSGIEKLEKLSYLILDDNKLSSLSGISQLKNLNSVSVDNNSISNADELLDLEKLYFASFSNNKLTTIPNFVKQSDLYLNFENNSFEKVVIPKSVASINLKGCNVKTIDYSSANRLTSIVLDGNPSWNDYSNLIVESIAGQEDAGRSYPSIYVTTDYNFSKDELNSLNSIQNKTGISWNISLREYTEQFEKSSDGVVSLEEHPSERALLMSLLKSGKNLDGLIIDRAATKLVLEDYNTELISLDSWARINNHLSAEKLTFIFK